MYIYVTCRWCEESIGLLGGNPTIAEVEENAVSWGWKQDDDGEWVCPKCQEEVD
jgi:hypothetical protein